MMVMTTSFTSLGLGIRATTVQEERLLLWTVRAGALDLTCVAWLDTARDGFLAPATRGARKQCRGMAWKVKMTWSILYGYTSRVFRAELGT